VLGSYLGVTMIDVYLLHLDVVELVLVFGMDLLVLEVLDWMDCY